MSVRSSAATYIDAVLERSLAAPDAPALTLLYLDKAAQTYSNAAVVARAHAYAARFVEDGVQFGDVVFLILRHGLDLHAAFLGAQLIGAVPSHLPFPSAKQHHETYWSIQKAVFERTGAAAIVVMDTLADEVRSAVAGARTRVISEASVRDSTDRPRRAVWPHNIALLQHSSGTTGLKKGIALSYAAIEGQIAAYGPAVGLTPSSCIATWLPLYHDMGLVACTVIPLAIGVHVVALDPFDWLERPGQLLTAIETYRATHCWLPNFAFNHLARAAPRKASFDLRSVVAFVNCSEPCKGASFDLFLDRFASCGVTASMLTTCYAMAETVFAVTQSAIGEAPRRIVVAPIDGRAGAAVTEPAAGGPSMELMSCGPAIVGMEIEARDGEITLDERRIGELCVRAPYLFSGYFAIEGSKPVGRWHRTGDLGFIDQGEVFVTGRLKDVIIVNGRNVHAHDVEAAVSGITGLKAGRAVAFGDYNAVIGSDRLVVVAELDSSPAAEASASSEIIRAIGGAVLDSTGVAVGDVRLVPPGWLVKTTSGKISRSDNVAKYHADFRSAGGIRT
jgi:acyl-CoA synthetase (AMP-forming)/AMP-acid ligase II